MTSGLGNRRYVNTGARLGRRGISFRALHFVAIVLLLSNLKNPLLFHGKLVNLLSSCEEKVTSMCRIKDENEHGGLFIFFVQDVNEKGLFWLRRGNSAPLLTTCFGNYKATLTESRTITTWQLSACHFIAFSCIFFQYDNDFNRVVVSIKKKATHSRLPKLWHQNPTDWLSYINGSHTQEVKYKALLSDKFFFLLYIILELSFLHQCTSFTIFYPRQEGSKYIVQ